MAESYPMSDTAAAKTPPLGHAADGSPLNFHQLFIFYTVASHSSFSRAAEALDITQPAVSIQVQELEKALGATLFHRRVRVLRLTEAGEMALAYARQIFSLSHRLVDSVQELQGLKAGRLILGASTTPGEFVLPLAVGQFRRLYPGIRVDLSIANTRAIIQRILSSEVDLGMVGERPGDPAGELEMLDYIIDEIVLVASPDHPVAARQPVTPAQAAEAGLIVRELGSATRQAAERHFAELGVQPNIALVLGSNHSVKQAAVGGGGVGVISRLGVEAEVKAGILTVLDVAGWHCRRPLTLVYPKTRQLSPAQRAFLAFLKSQRPAT
ncbi:MAG: LysR family transcriptional regulator [Dehalococcoidia bacterium]|nr:LysR family transcriptional regulator [Dehalococcoidia bacterium]